MYMYSLIKYLIQVFYPDAGGEGYIVPLHRRGTVVNVENYMGINLLSVIGKLSTLDKMAGP